MQPLWHWDLTGMQSGQEMSPVPLEMCTSPSCCISPCRISGFASGIRVKANSSPDTTSPPSHVWRRKERVEQKGVPLKTSKCSFCCHDFWCLHVLARQESHCSSWMFLFSHWLLVIPSAFSILQPDPWSVFMAFGFGTCFFFSAKIFQIIY